MNLTYREKTVVRALREGKSNKIIGHELGLTACTVKNYVHRLREKYQVGSRIELALIGDDDERAFQSTRDLLRMSHLTVAQARELLLLIVDRSR